jgi:hypothetical protein
VPFGGDTVPAVLYQISHGEPSIDDLDEGLRHLVMRALAKDPQQRPLACRPWAAASRTRHQQVRAGHSSNQ